MKALDLFCGAGGASQGLVDAGFEVTGVDINPQPNYQAGAFIQADAISFLTGTDLTEFDFIWASPPCQAFTAYQRRPGHVRPRPNLIPPVREALLALPSRPYWVIENVPGAPLRGYNAENPVTLCGSSFGLDVRRHRLFESNFHIPQPACQHHTQARRFPAPTNNRNLRRTVEVGVWRIPLDVQQRAMGINWMTLRELSQSIPPAYSHYIADQAIPAIIAR